MNLKVDLAWILAVAQHVPGDPQVVDYGVPVAAEARLTSADADPSISAPAGERYSRE